MGTIVCGVDRSLGARTAVLTAVDLGGEFGVEVVAVHVVPSVQRELDVYLGERAQRTASELVASMLEGNEHAPDITVLGSVGDRAERLTRVAREHDASLIVLGARTQGLGRSCGAASPPSCSRRARSRSSSCRRSCSDRALVGAHPEGQPP